MIIRRARRLATQCYCCVHEISRRVGRRMQRSPVTILHTIRKYDTDHPDEAVFPLAAEELSESERGKILRGHRRGLPIRLLARRSCRPRSAVYRVLLEERLARLARRKVKFIDDPLYHQPDAEAVVAAIASAGGELEGQRKAEERRVPRDLPPYLAELYRTALLSPARESALFLAFNFHKFRFVTARRRLDPQFSRGGAM